MRMGLNNFIQIYKEAFSSSFCDHLVEKFEEDKQHQYLVQHQFGQGTYFDVPLSEDHDKIIEIFQEHIEHYKDDVPEAGCWPKEYGWETIRMKRFKANDTDGYKTHVDVWDHASARRSKAVSSQLRRNRAYFAWDYWRRKKCHYSGLE